MARKVIGLCTSLAVALLVLWPSSTWATGVGASPGDLYFDDGVSGFTQTLRVLNTGYDESTYTVYAEGEYESWFEVSPDRFSLVPGECEEVAITLSPPSGACGEYEASVCVVSYEPSSGLRIGAGIKVPAHITIVTPVPAESVVSVPMWIALAIVLPAVLLGVFVVWRRRSTIGAR